MPKKISTNPKAVEARARKEEKKRTENEKIVKAKEDAYWADDDKLINRKVNRKDERDRKKQEELEKKQLNKQLYEEEMNSLKTSSKPQPPQKVTRSQIATIIQKEETKAKTSRSTSLNKSSSEVSLEENPNIAPIEQASASNIDEALSILNVKDEPVVDKHPEKRMKAAYQAFEDVRLKELKQENANLRLSQLKQMLRKEWLKSPDNPMNQAAIVVQSLK